MIKRRAMSLFIVALIMGLAAAWIANQWLQSRIVPTAEASTVSVVVAAMEIPFSHKIEPVHLKTINWPADTVPAGVYNDVAEVEGKVASQKMYSGELVLKSRVVEQVAGSTLSAIVTPGMRAVTVRVNDVIGVAGFLLPGNRVDVIASRKNESRRAETMIILEDLKVLAVDQSASPDKDNPVVVRAVTLEIDPEHAKKLVKATEEGTVQLALRNPTDDSKQPVAEEKPVVEEKPVAEKKSPVVEKRIIRVAKPKPKDESVTVIRGTHVDVSKVKL